jgi:ribosomal protein L7/L12
MILPMEEHPEPEFTIILTHTGPNKINVMMIVRRLTNLSLKDAKYLRVGHKSE